MNAKLKALPVLLIASLFLFSPVILALEHGSTPSGKLTSKKSHYEFVPAKRQANLIDTPYGFAVNPMAIYTVEPAPVGIADYGLGPGGVPYTYNTTSFLGVMNISSLYASGSHGTSITVQLNVMLQFQLSNGITYVYWIQDVAFIATSSYGSQGTVNFIDNVWNMSSSTASMLTSSIQGNGSVSSYGGLGYYYDTASSLPGNIINMLYPGHILLRVNSYESADSTPAVSFQYNDGYGWQTFDNTIFGFASNQVSAGADRNFVVNGKTYNPEGLFYDAELVLGGPGGGSTTTLNTGNMSLSLQFYNGHNFQEVSNAYNFGSDTAETISNVADPVGNNISSGYIYDRLTPGPGALISTYNSLLESWFSISSIVPDGYLYINGQKMTQFVNGYLNYTISPGTYAIQVYYPLTNAFVAVGGPNVTLRAGLGLSFKLSYNLVEFQSQGIPAGISWKVSMGGTAKTTTGGEISFVTMSGTTYTYSVSTGALYRASPSSGTFTASSSFAVIVILWASIPTYGVYFNETGLPAGKTWQVTFNGVTESSNSRSISYTEPIGIFGFNIAGISGFKTYPSAGDVSVISIMSIDVRFVPNSNNTLGVVSSTILLQNGTTISGEYLSSASVFYYPYQVAYDSHNGVLYSANVAGNSVSLVNTANDEWLSTIPLPGALSPRIIVYDPLNNMVYVGGSTNEIFVINTSTNIVTETIGLTYSGSVMGIAVNTQNGSLYVAQSNTLYGFTSKNQMKFELKFGSGTQTTTLCYNTANRNLLMAYTDSTGYSNLSVYDTATMLVVKNVTLQYGSSINSILYDPYNDRLYLTGTSNVTILNATTYASDGKIVTNSQSYGAAIDPFTGYVYIITKPDFPSYTFFNLTVLDSSTDKVIGTIPMPYGSMYPVYASAVQKIYMAGNTEDSIYSVSPAHYYLINVSESNLPDGTFWYFNLSGSKSYFTDSSYIVLYEPNGNYSFTVSSTNNTWKPVIGTSSFSVKGSNLTLNVRMELALFKITFTEQGLPGGLVWYVLIDGKNLSALAGSNITIELTNGTYSYSVGEINGYILNSPAGNITLNGTNRIFIENFISNSKLSHGRPSLIGPAEIAGIFSVITLIAGFVYWRTKR